MPEHDWILERHRMVEEHLRVRGVRDAAVLSAMEAVPRERFVPESGRHQAYADAALPIAHGQTISQPYIVAYMTAALNVTPRCRVLEVGTGSGYQTAVLAQLADHVYTIERLDELRALAADTLADLGITNVTLRGGDGSLGLMEFAPYDRIIVTAGAPRVPPALVDQLVEGGRMVLPVGGMDDQTIVCVERYGGTTIETPLLACRFVKLIGREGWEEIRPPDDAA